MLYNKYTKSTHLKLCLKTYDVMLINNSYIILLYRLSNNQQLFMSMANQQSLIVLFAKYHLIQLFFSLSHPWDTVAKAAWRKYPNPINPAVVSLDVLDRKVERGILKSHRLIGSSWSLPQWVNSVSISVTNVTRSSYHSRKKSWK